MALAMGLGILEGLTQPTCTQAITKSGHVGHVMRDAVGHGEGLEGEG